MSRLSVATVDRALRAFKLDVEWVPGASLRGSDSFNPRGGVAHHTAGPIGGGDLPSLNVLKNGRAGLAGPLCNFGLGRSGRVYVVALGRANHAGVGGWKGLVGNSSVIGIEAENNGYQSWPFAQLDAYYRLAAACCVMSGFAAGYWSMHKEWCSPPGRKPDPHTIVGNHFRMATAIHVAAYLLPSAPPPPPPPPPTPAPGPGSTIPLTTAREDADVLLYIRNPHSRDQIWVTNGIGKRHVGSTEEIDQMRFFAGLQGVENIGEKNSMGPVDVPARMFDSIPTFA